jgi:hypothetical protein
MALKFKMDVKTFLLLKTVKVYFFVKFALFPIFLKKTFFLNIQIGRKIQYDRFFAKKFISFW